MSAGGLKIDILAPRSRFYHGPFGRLCPDVEPWAPAGVPLSQIDQFLLDFANKHMIEAPGLTPSQIAGDAVIRDELEAKFGSKTPAGYTYFGQFIDHDITFDPASSLVRRNDPNALFNFRTPRLDLDNVYGRGPADSPYLYDQTQPGKLLIGQSADTQLRDLPRNSQGRALIGDMRNDENAIVSQLQLGFLLAHNTLVDRATAQGMSDPFEAARRTLRWLYQWLVWNDFAKRISLDKVHACGLQLTKTCDGRKVWELGLSDVYSWKHQPFMPIEFAGAAYRFGHSMVRNSYQTNQPLRGFGVFVPIFDNSGAANPDDLRGFRPMESENVPQWDWFLPMTSSGGPFPQTARKIDTKLSNALAFLHEGPVGDVLNVLAYRNLKRGFTFDLPTGTGVAKKWCLKPLKIDGKRHLDALWYYILREAGTLPGAKRGETLGRVGSVIVCATFAGLLKGDPSSYFNLEPCWTPNDDPLLCPGKDNIDSGGGKTWEVASIIRLAGLPVDGGDVGQQAAGQFPDTVACP